MSALPLPAVVRPDGPCQCPHIGARIARCPHPADRVVRRGEQVLHLCGHCDLSGDIRLDEDRSWSS